MSLSPSTAWTIRRLMTSRSDGQHRVTIPNGRFRSITDQLSSVPPGQREAVFRTFLECQDDQAEISRALADVDPDGPAPTLEDDRQLVEDDWGLMTLGSTPTPAGFPVDVLPAGVRRLVVEGARAIGCPPDFIAVAALAVAAGAIGRSVRLRLKAGYFASSSLFAALVGPPSDGKTPALRGVCAAVRRIDKLLQADHQRAMESWQIEQEERVGKNKRARPLKSPEPRRIDVDDITMEMMPLLLADNPRGLIRINDELTSLMLGMNQYKGGKGNDRPYLLKIWSGEGIKKDRVGHDANVPILCPRPCLTIIGGLPPDMLGSMMDQQSRSDGFLDRFLFVYPESRPIPEWSQVGIEDETIDRWCDIVARLWDRPMDSHDGRPVPHVTALSGPALECWRDQYNLHCREMNDEDFPATLRGPWGKLREYAGRLTLILACLRHAADPDVEPAQVPTISEDTVRDAWRLVAYFKSHHRRVYGSIARDPGTEKPTFRTLVEWLRSKPIESFSISEFRQARRSVDPATIEPALRSLVRANVLRLIKPTGPAPKGGRPASPGYHVNPTLYLADHPEPDPSPPHRAPGGGFDDGF